jgi:hypothetical protein
MESPPSRRQTNPTSRDHLCCHRGSLLKAGLIVADRYGAEIVREAPARTIAPATRRAVMLRFAIASADRLHRLADPEGAF